MSKQWQMFKMHAEGAKKEAGRPDCHCFCGVVTYVVWSMLAVIGMVMWGSLATGCRISEVAKPCHVMPLPSKCRVCQMHGTLSEELDWEAKVVTDGMHVCAFTTQQARLLKLGLHVCSEVQYLI